MRARAGDDAGAAGDLAAGAAAVRAMPPGPARWFGARLREAEAAAAARTSPARSAAALDSAVAFFAPEGNPLHLLPALVARADARLALGDAEGAAADLDRATARLSELGDGVAGAAARAALLDAARAVFDRMVMLRARQGRAADALAALERGRASLSVARRTAGGASGAALPRGETAVAYALVGDTLLAWTVSGREVRMARATVGREALGRMVERAGSALELGAGEAARAPLAALYDRLVRPLEAGLGADGAPLVVVADGEVAAAPFAALLDTVRGRYLVEAHALRFAPTLRDAARRAPRLPSAPRALVVADPAFDPGAWPGLQRLRGAAAEAGAVAALYPGAAVLAGAAADREAFARALPGAQVVHYAGHALFDDARPAASALVLAGAGRLDAAEVARMDLHGVRLVVLSACRTLRSGGGRSGGFAGLSGALLGAGAGGVVGGTGEVDDATTRALMAAFHRAWLRTGDAPAALREAQLRLLRSSDPALRSPAAWGTFRYAGS
jgi:CHAT domain-containing protein